MDPRTSQQPSEPIFRVYENVEYEILPVSNFVSSPLVTTTSALLASMITPEDEEHDERVIHAKHARAIGVIKARERRRLRDLNSPTSVTAKG